MAPAVVTVTNTLDTTAVGDGVSLREAIQSINTGMDINTDVTHSGTYGTNDTINFAIPDSLKLTAGNWWTIQLQSGLPTVTDKVAIDGTSAPGYAGSPLIEVRGLGVPHVDGGDGLTFGMGSSGSCVRGLVLNSFGNTDFGSGNNAIHLAGAGATGIVIAGNYIGTDPTGTQPVWNADGVLIDGGASGNTVGGTTAADRNVISGNYQAAVNLTDSGTKFNVIAGNYIGTDVSGLAAVPNSAPNGLGVVRIYGGASDNLIGGSAPGAGNLISGNNITKLTGDISHTGDGIGITGVGTDRNKVQGNLIGTDRTGNVALPNGWHGSGVFIRGGAQCNVIGTNGDGVNDGSEGNIISGNLSDGIDIADIGTDYNVVAGNIIGLGLDGSTPLGNGYGVAIWAGVTANRIGTSADSDNLERNIISSNRADGVLIGNGEGTAGNVVAGNFIGTDSTGLLARGNGGGVRLLGAGSNQIGGAPSVERNVISGNGYGVVLESNRGLGTSGVQILGNYIGTDKTGAPVLGNRLVGVYLMDGSTNNVIGGSAPGAGNLIAGNTGSGVLIQGSTSVSNTVSANSISSNGGLGIDLTSSDTVGLGVTVNDSLGHVGGNNFQNFPVLASAFTSGTNTTITGTFSEAAEPNTAIKLDFYINAVPDPSGYGQGQTYIGSNPVAAPVSTDSSGNASFSVTLPVAVTPGQFVTATATDPTGNTSEFSVALQVPLQVASVTTVTASANPSVLNQSVTFTATVTPVVGNGTPTGTVQFQIDNVNFGSPVALTTAGTATSGPTAALAVGPHTITAIYSGDGSFIGSSGSLTQNVQYNFSGFLAPLNKTTPTGNLGKQIPIKFLLKDVSGNPVSFATVAAALSAVTSLQVQLVDSSGNPLAAPFTPASNTGMTYDPAAQQFTFSWQTKGLSAGYYKILLALNDATIQTKIIQLIPTGKSAGLTTSETGGTGSTGASALLAGDITLYVDNTNADLTADELTRIQDAVTAADAVTEPYGVAVQEVTDPTLADVTLNMDTTSAVGGYAAGVLGCTTDAGRITIINGWNFYAGRDATQIGSAQYDFETVVEHELGHALGLGHSTDGTSVMYATLNTGTVSRTLNAADLNVADSDTTGACGLHAATIPTLAATSPPIPLGTNSIGRDAFFALLVRQSPASVLVNGGKFNQPASDAAFAARMEYDPTNRELVDSSVNMPAIDGTPIFGAASLGSDEDAIFGTMLFSDPLQDGRADDAGPSKPAASQPDGEIDFMPNDGVIGLES
jgi:hypothetical protein